jgi:hypothetical protein
MKFKIILTTAILFLFSSSVFAGMCFPVAQIYLNQETKVEKQLPCDSLLNKLTNIPFSTTSFNKSEVISDSFCASRDISSIQELTFQDFSTFDKAKIIINSLFALVLVLLPLGLLIIVSKKIKSFWIRIILNLVLIIGYIPWLFIISGGFGSC